LVLLANPRRAKRIEDTKTGYRSLLPLMMIPSAHSGGSSTHDADSHPGARFIAMEPSTPTEEAERGPTMANDPIDAFSIGVMMVGTTMRETGTIIIAKIISLCGFTVEPTMVRYMDQQGWTELEHVTTIGVDEVNDFFTFEVTEL
jgi:hypothetical protein